MKLIFPLVGFLGGISASLNPKILSQFTEYLNSGKIMREIQLRTLRGEITNVFGHAYTEDFYEEGSDVEKKYESMKEAYFQSIISKKRSNFSPQKRIFKYGCLLFFKKRVQEKKGSDVLRALDMVTHRIIANPLNEYADKFFVDQSEVSDAINEDVENEGMDEACYKENVKRILSYYLRVLSRLSGGMRGRFVYFQALKEDILSILKSVSSDIKLSQGISDVFLKLDESAKTCLQRGYDDASLEAFVGLSKDSIILLEGYKASALKAFREHSAAKIKDHPVIKKKEMLPYNKRGELKLICLFDLVISTVSCCCEDPGIELLKSFSFNLLSYYMHKSIDYHFMDDLKEEIEKKSGSIDNPALDKVLSEVFLDAHRINNVFNFTIRDDELFSAANASKDPEPESGGWFNNPIETAKDTFWNLAPNISSWGKGKTDFDAQDEKIRKEKKSARKYINQKEDSFTMNDELMATHPHPGTKDQRRYYTSHFNNKMRDRDIHISSTNTINLEKYVDEMQVLVMVECVKILEYITRKKLEKISSEVNYNKLDSNKKYVESILADKDVKDMFRFIRLQVAYDSAADAGFIDKKSGDFLGFHHLITAMAAKNFIGTHESEYSELQEAELFWGFVVVALFAVSMVLGYIIYNSSFKKSFKRRVRKEKR